MNTIKQFKIAHYSWWIGGFIGFILGLIFGKHDPWGGILAGSINGIFFGWLIGWFIDRKKQKLIFQNKSDGFTPNRSTGIVNEKSEFKDNLTQKVIVEDVKDYKEINIKNSYREIYKSIYDFDDDLHNEFKKDEFLKEMQRIISEFYERDNISPQKLTNNLATNKIIMEYGSLDLYENVQNVSIERDNFPLTPTKSFKEFFCGEVFDRPRGFPEWFIIGYPDVAMWINKNMRTLQSRIMSMKGIEGPDGKPTLKFFRSIIDLYKEDNKLELIIK